MSSEVLRSRDINTQQPPSPTKSGKDIKSMDYHRRVLDKKLEEENSGQNYVSPSDAIMSPASQKLSSFKQKQMNKSAIKPRSLFAKAMSSREKDLGSVKDVDQGKS